MTLISSRNPAFLCCRSQSRAAALPRANVKYEESRITTEDRCNRHSNHQMSPNLTHDLQSQDTSVWGLLLTDIIQEREKLPVMRILTAVATEEGAKIKLPVFC